MIRSQQGSVKNLDELTMMMTSQQGAFRGDAVFCPKTSYVVTHPCSTLKTIKVFGL